MTDSGERNKEEISATVVAGKENSYRSILKGVSIFGGVQIFLILINLVRGKFVAMFLGPSGMGISSLFTSVSNTITKASSLGLNLAIVKEVAQNHEDPGRLRQILAVVYTLLRFTAIMGVLVCVLGSRWLSMLTFHSPDYAWQFMLLAVAVYFTIIGTGRLSLLQGLHEVKALSRASLVGAFTGLLAGVPLYYWFGDKGIVPAMVVLALTTYVFYYRHTRHLTTDVRFNWKEHKDMARRFIGLGIMLLAGDLIGTLCVYLLNIYLRSAGGTETVGLFQAANSISNQYMGAVFAALSLDYFPRLSKAVADNTKMCEVVNRQSEIVILGMSPLAALMIITAPWLVRLLLTAEFLPALDLIKWMGLGIMLRAMQYPMGYIAFAKNNKRVFFLLEVIFGNVLNLACNITFFHYLGLTGLGYSLIVENIISFAIYYWVNKRLYGYRFNRNVLKDFAICPILCTTCFLGTFVETSWLSVLLSITTLSATIFYSVINIRTLIRKDKEPAL